MKPWKLIFFAMVGTLGWQAVKAIFSDPPAAVEAAKPAADDKYANTTQYVNASAASPAAAAEPAQEAAAAEPAAAPEPPAEEEKPVIWPGKCYSGGQTVWSGNAINFAQTSCTGGNSGCQEFTDYDTKKRIQIEGTYSCVWVKPEGA